MSDFEYRIAALCRDGKVSTGINSSPDRRATKRLCEQLAAAGEFRDVWVERGTTLWERVVS